MDSRNYIESLNIQFTYLFSFASKINEIDSVVAVFGEQRGMQAAGWNTTGTAQQVFDELTKLVTQGKELTLPQLRQTLCLYTHLSEAGGVYEGLQNLLNVPKLIALNMWPFRDMVRVRKSPKAVIGPNSNAVFRRLATAAYEVGMPKLAELFELAFRDDIRNAIAHADYVIVPDGLRLPKRNGGNPTVITNKEVQNAIELAILFFEALQNFQEMQLSKYSPARNVIGKFSANPPMLYSIGFSESGQFSLKTSSPGPQTDAAYDRQQLINDHLGGKMIALFYRLGQPELATICDAIASAGFEPSSIVIDDSARYSALLENIHQNQLWDEAATKENSADAVLVVTPFGFGYVATAKDFQSLLPKVEPIEFPERTESEPIEIKNPDQIYLSLMMDAKVRILNTERLLENQSKPDCPAIDIEFCHLQCRRIVEDITFGALIREHGRYIDLRQATSKNKDLQKSDISSDWNAKEILKLLVKLSPHVLPIPISDPTKITTGTFHFERVKMEVNHSKLIEIYTQAGGFLHGMNPLKSDYWNKINDQRKKYESAHKPLVETIQFLRTLLWSHAAVTLEYSGKNPTDLDSPKTAWILDFSPVADHEVKMIIGTAKQDAQTPS
ncbi:MAG: hypothetical protein ACAH17_00670 [Candidatus Paceibacterota bacterium]